MSGDSMCEQYVGITTNFYEAILFYFTFFFCVTVCGTSFISLLSLRVPSFSFLQPLGRVQIIGTKIGASSRTRRRIVQHIVRPLAVLCLHRYPTRRHGSSMQLIVQFMVVFVFVTCCFVMPQQIQCRLFFIGSFCVTQWTSR